MTTNDMAPNSDADSVQQMIVAIATVKRLLAAGLLDAAALGVTAPAPQARETNTAPGWALVPGEPILMRDLIAKTKAGITTSSFRAWAGYLDLLVDGYHARGIDYDGIGDKFAHEVLPSDLRVALEFVGKRAVATAQERAIVRESVGRAVRRSSGAGAQGNAVAAWRRAFKVAVEDRHISTQFNPASGVEKPRRSAGRRRPMSTQQLTDFWSVVAGTGNDPELDTLLCITIVISGARREGLIRLSLGDLNRVNGTILLDEKNRKALPQPVPDWLLHELEVFARSRGARKPTDKVFRLNRRPGQLAGNPITSRRLDNVFQRVQSSLPWADEAQLTAHTLRHHAIGLVERHAGSQVAAAFARHEPDGTTAGYGRASDEEVAQAVIDLHGGKHPWIERQDGVDASDQNGQDESAIEGEDDSVVDE